ncbi:hypothetical protein Dimus_033588, partial [Dionaea muscipula]
PPEPLVRSTERQLVNRWLWFIVWEYWDCPASSCSGPVRSWRPWAGSRPVLANTQ